MLTPAPDPSALLQQFLSEFLFDDTRRRIMAEQARPLAAHVAEFRAHLEAKGDGAKHVRDTVRRVRVVLRLCRAAHWKQLSPAAMLAAVDRLRKARPRRAALGLSTVNHYIHAVKAFARWMVLDYRAERSPCLSLRPYNARTDVRRVRRALCRQEMLALIYAATHGRVICGIPGAERAMMYTLACTTGLRAGELESLTRASFILGQEPHVVVEAAYSKHRRRDVLPLRADVAEMVRIYLAGVGRDAKLFRRPHNGNGTRALREDLAVAGVPYCQDGQYADFHSQRHTFVSNLFESGATPKEAQTLARHQDPRMTLGRYAHITDKAQRAAVERLGAPCAPAATINATTINTAAINTSSAAPSRGER